MKTTLKGIFLFVLLIPSIAQAATYYVRADGTAGNKAAATSCSAASTAMSISKHNSETFTDDDFIYLCDDGGAFTDTLTVPSSGSSTSDVITYTAASGDSVEFTPTSSKAFRTAGKDYITLDCDAGGGSITFYADDDLTSGYPGVVEAVNSEYITISDCEIDGSTMVSEPNTYRGIFIGGHNGNNYTIADNTIHDIHKGIFFEMQNESVVHYATISGNTIYNMQRLSGNGNEDCIGLSSAQCSGALCADASGVIIEYNDCYGSVYDDGIDLFTANGATVRYNEIGPFNDNSIPGITLIKMGGGSNAGNNNIVYGNYLHDCSQTGGSCWGISCNEGGGGSKVYANVIENLDDVSIYCRNTNGTSSDPVYIYNNTVVCTDGVSKGIIPQSNTYSDIYIRNNIVDGNCVGDGIGSGTDNTTDIYIQYNVVDDTINCQAGGGGNCTADNNQTNTDPKLNDTASKEFWLQSSSPAIDAGAYIDISSDIALLPGSVWPTDVVAVDPYMDGTQREIGAYAYGGNIGNTPVDNCPYDPSKTQPGLCGCGVSDADSDSDDIPNCNDNCPNDSGNDVDGDEICAYDDNCPTVSNANQADSDGDGIGNACDPFPNESDHEKGQLIVDLAQAQAELSQLQSDFNQCSTSLYQCDSDLSQSEADVAQCDSDLSQSEADMAQAQAELSQSQADFNQCSTSLYQCDSDLSQSEADMAQCSADLSQCEFDKGVEAL